MTKEPELTTELPSTISHSWCVLLTNDKYLTGLLTLVYSLYDAKEMRTRFPMIILYSPKLSTESHDKINQLIQTHGNNLIFKRQVELLVPLKQADFSTTDERFADTWTKLQVFSLTQLSRVALLDLDMVVLRNMDELLDPEAGLELTDEVPVAACHVCACNPFKLAHYPRNWVPENCAYTGNVEINRDVKSVFGPDCHRGVGMLNSGLLVVKPSLQAYNKVMDLLRKPEVTEKYTFPDQELISDAFRGKWVGLSYRYNALKTLRTIHADVWDDDSVKNVHYIRAPKPWNAAEGYEDSTGTFRIWNEINQRRLADERLGEGSY